MVVIYEKAKLLLKSNPCWRKVYNWVFYENIVKDVCIRTEMEYVPLY